MFTRMVNTAAFNRRIELVANDDIPLRFEDSSAAKVERMDEKPARGIINIPSEAERVYVCSPFRGNIEQNTENAKKYCRYVLLQGKIPIAPHLYLPQFMSEDTEREQALKINFQLMSICDELWVFTDKDHYLSEGMKAEINYWKIQRTESIVLIDSLY